METHVSKLNVQGQSIYVKLTWKQSEHELFHIKIFETDCCWSGRFSNEFAQQFRERHNIEESEETYATNVKKALLGTDENYAYEFTKSPYDEESGAFSWKKRFKGINVLHGKVPIHRDTDPEPITILVDILLNKNAELKKEMNKLNTKTDGLESDLDKTKNELEKYVNIKTKLETNLYGRFVQLLNAKKRRIQLLEDDLLKFEEPYLRSELD